MSNQITPNPSVPSQVVQELKFPKFITNLGIIPTSYKDSMSYYECLAWLCKYLEETVIPTLNENGEAVEELQGLYVELNSYVTNYFDTLDVQEEINNKLDDMVEAGTLQEIIADYLNAKAVFGFDSVAEMKASTNLINGSYARTLGYYEKNDGGSALYKIRNITNDDVIDEMFIIEMDDEENQLIAELIYDETLNIKQIGAKGDGTSDDTSIIQAALNKVTNIYVPQGTYLISSTLQMNDCKSIIGENALYSKIYASNPDVTLLKLKTGNTYNIQIKDMKFEHASVGTGNGIEFGNSGNWQTNIIENCRFTNNNIAITVLNSTGSLYSSVIKNVELFNYNSGIALYNIGSSGNIYSNIYMHNNDRTAQYGFLTRVEDNATIENLNVEWSQYAFPLNLSQVRGTITNLHVEGVTVTGAIMYLYDCLLNINNLEILNDSNFTIFDINNGHNNIVVDILRLKNYGNSSITVTTLKYTNNLRDTDHLKIYHATTEGTISSSENSARFGCHRLPEVYNGIYSEKILNNWKIYYSGDATIKDAKFRDSIQYQIPVTKDGNQVFNGVCIASGISTDELFTNSATVDQYANHVDFPKSLGIIPSRTAIKINDVVFFTSGDSYSHGDDYYRSNLNQNVQFASGTYSLYKTSAIFTYY